MPNNSILARRELNTPRLSRLLQRPIASTLYLKLWINKYTLQYYTNTSLLVYAILLIMPENGSGNYFVAGDRLASTHLPPFTGRRVSKVYESGGLSLHFHAATDFDSRLSLIG
jgi:hypothetical protein